MAGERAIERALAAPIHTVEIYVDGVLYARRTAVGELRHGAISAALLAQLQDDNYMHTDGVAAHEFPSIERIRDAVDKRVIRTYPPAEG